MSMISEQAKELRYKADVFEKIGCAVDGIVKEFRKAADTIEALSERLAEENKKQSSRYCGEEKQLIEAMAEEIENCYGRETELSERARDYLDKTDYDDDWIPCSERLPENISTVVLQLREIKKPTFGYYSNMGKEWMLLERNFIDLEEFSVIAWQPLPESYKGEEVAE